MDSTQVAEIPGGRDPSTGRARVVPLRWVVIGGAAVAVLAGILLATLGGGGAPADTTGAAALRSISSTSTTLAPTTLATTTSTPPTTLAPVAVPPPTQPTPSAPPTRSTTGRLRIAWLFSAGMIEGGSSPPEDCGPMTSSYQIQVKDGSGAIVTLGTARGGTFSRREEYGNVTVECDAPYTATMPACRCTRSFLSTPETQQMSTTRKRRADRAQPSRSSRRTVPSARRPR